MFLKYIFEQIDSFEERVSEKSTIIEQLHATSIEQEKKIESLEKEKEDNIKLVEELKEEQKRVLTERNQIEK